MDKSKNKRRRKTTLIKVFLLGLIITSLIHYGYHLYIFTKGGVGLVRHQVIIDGLNEYYKSTGLCPENLDKFASFDSYINRQKTNIYSLIQNVKEHYGLIYYPEAWGKPGKILLVSGTKDGDIVTFGDGSRARLYKYYISDLKAGEIFDPYPRRLELQTKFTYAPLYPYLTTLALPLGLLVIIIFYDIIFLLKASPSENEN